MLLPRQRFVADQHAATFASMTGARALPAHFLRAQFCRLDQYCSFGPPSLVLADLHGAKAKARQAEMTWLWVAPTAQARIHACGPGGNLSTEAHRHHRPTHHTGHRRRGKMALDPSATRLQASKLAHQPSIRTRFAFAMHSVAVGGAAAYGYVRSQHSAACCHRAKPYSAPDQRLAACLGRDRGPSTAANKIQSVWTVVPAHRALGSAICPPDLRFAANTPATRT